MSEERKLIIFRGEKLLEGAERHSFERLFVLGEDGYWQCQVCYWQTAHEHRARNHARNKHGMVEKQEE